MKCLEVRQGGGDRVVFWHSTLQLHPVKLYQSIKVPYDPGRRRVTVFRSCSTLVFCNPLFHCNPHNLNSLFHSTTGFCITILGDSDRRVLGQKGGISPFTCSVQWTHLKAHGGEKSSTQSSGQKGCTHFSCAQCTRHTAQCTMHNAQCKTRHSGTVGEVGRVMWLLAWPVKAFGLNHLCL